MMFVAPCRPGLLVAHNILSLLLMMLHARFGFTQSSLKIRHSLAFSTVLIECGKPVWQET